MSNLTDQIKRSPFKAATIPLLALVLLRVMLSGGKQNTSTPEATASSPSTSSATAELDQAPQPAGASARVERQWPQLAVREVIRHNPFTLTGRRDTTAEIDDLELAEEAPQPVEAAVSAYLTTSEGVSAVIDRKIVREGDVVDDDWYVQQLSPETAVLAPRLERRPER